MSVGGIHRGVRPPLGAHGGKLRHNWTQWGGRTPPQDSNIYELYLMSWRYTLHCTLTIHYSLFTPLDKGSLAVRKVQFF